MAGQAPLTFIGLYFVNETKNLYVCPKSDIFATKKTLLICWTKLRLRLTRMTQTGTETQIDMHDSNSDWDSGTDSGSVSEHKWSGDIELTHWLLKLSYILMMMMCGPNSGFGEINSQTYHSDI